MRDRLDEYVRCMASLDAETHRMVPGLHAPPLVCGSTATAEPGSERFLTRAEWLAAVRELCASRAVWVNANVPFDAAVAAAADFSLIGPLLDKFDRDSEVFDVLLAQALDAIAGGHLFKDPVTMQPLSKDDGKKRARYNLDNTTQLVLGRTDAKLHALWRTRFAILERVPLADWPADALAYVLDDARNPVDIARAQVLGVRGRRHEWTQREAWAGEFEEVCRHCDLVFPRGLLDESTLAPCTERQLTTGHRNLHGMAHEVRAKFAMELGAAHGFRTDGALLDKIEAEVEAKRAKHRDRFLKSGLLKVGGKHGIQDARGVIKARLARAHGASRPCTACGGTGKVPKGANGNLVICGEKYVEGGCDGTGLDLSDARTLSRTDLGAVQAGRDFLEESGDEELMLLAEYHEDDKVTSTYLPYLRGGVDQPLNPSPNSLVESGRVSYDGAFMLLPKEGPLRRSVIARPGHVYCECDYAAGELSTLAQVCVWKVHYSVMGDIINASKDPGILHARFAGHLLGCTAEEVDRRRKAGDKRAADFRQAAKPFNYGLGGGMGAPKVVLANRKRIVGTTLGPDGTEYIGIRFCILLDGAEACSRPEDMITEWRGRETKPVCRRCVEVAARARSEWFSFFPEVAELHRWVGQQVDLEEGMKSYGWGMYRGGLGYTDGCNHLFQNLLAVGAKRALWLLTREMYDERRGSPLFGSRLGMFQHDSTLIEMPEDVAHLAGPRQSELMIEGLKAYVPDIFVGCEPALSVRWDKRAKAVYEGGRLVVWEPPAEEVAA